MTRRLLRLVVLVGSLAGWSVGCSAGEGTGEIESDKLWVEGCWNGPFRLGPTFFGANPYSRTRTVLFRIQRGDNIEEFSDGLTMVVRDVGVLRTRLGEAIPVGLPAGVRPPGAAIPAGGASTPDVSMSLYPHDSCNVQLGVLHAISGTITFSSLFSGDLNENRGEDRLTDATFVVTMADPRDASPDGTLPKEKTSELRGRFRFYFQKGQPAQPFPK